MKDSFFRGLNILTEVAFHFIIDFSNFDIKTYTDGTNFASSFLEDLHEVGFIEPLILGRDWNAETGCKGFVVISENYKNSREIVRKLPRYSEHRILLIFKGAISSLNDLLISGTAIFLDADVAAVASGDLTSGYIMAQPKRAFVRQAKFKKWRYSTKGPKDFQGREILATTYNCSMFSRLGPISRNGTPAWVNGAEIELFEDIASRLNLVTKYRAANRPKNNRVLWYEKELKDKRSYTADVAFCGILMSNKKFVKDVVMSAPETIVCLQMLVPRPEPLSTEWNGIFQPFEPELWFAIGMAVMGMAFLLQRLVLSSNEYANSKYLKKYEGLGVSFLQMVSILVMTNIPSSTSKQRAARHLITWWAMFTLVLSTCYSSGLVTHLTRREYTETPDTFEELVKGRYSWASITMPDFSELLDSYDLSETAWKYRFKLLKSWGDHVTLLEKDKKQALWGYKVFNGFTLPEYDLPDRVMDKFQSTGYCFMEYFIGIALRDGCPFENPINKYIQAYNEAGLMLPLFNKVYNDRREKHKYVYRVLRKTKSRMGESKGLQLENLLGIILVWCLGMAVSIVVFLLELAQRCWI